MAGRVRNRPLKEESRNIPIPPATFGFNDISSTEEVGEGGLFCKWRHVSGENEARHNPTELCIVSSSAKRQKDEEGDAETYLGDPGVEAGPLNRTHRMTAKKEF